MEISEKTRDRISGLLLGVLPLLAAIFHDPDLGFKIAIPPAVIAGAKIAGPLIGSILSGKFGRRKRADLPFDPGLSRIMERNYFNAIQKAIGQGGFLSPQEREFQRTRTEEGVVGLFRPTLQRAQGLVSAQNLEGTSAGADIIRDVGRTQRGAVGDIAGITRESEVGDKLRLLEEMRAFLGRTGAQTYAGLSETQRRPQNAALYANLLARFIELIPKKGD